MMDPLQQQQNPFMSMMGAPQPQPGMPPVPQFGSQQTPLPPQVQQMATPASTPDEVATRKEGWQQVLNNPNFMRAIGLMGAQLMQPKPVGQSSLGHLGVGLATGIGAFEQGEYSTWRQKLAEKEETRRTAESAANIRARGAQAATEEARLPGVQAETRTVVETADDKITQARVAREKAELDLTNAKDLQGVTQIENALKKRRLEIERDIPDARIRTAALAELDAAALKAEEARARLGKTKADARKAGAEAAQQEITTDILKKMSPEEQKAFLTKTGRYSATQSGVAQQAEMWGQLYDKLPEENPAKKGKTREEFQMSQLTEAKGQDALKLLTDYLKNTLDPDPEIVQIYTDLAKAAGRKRQTAGGTPAEEPAGKEVPWQDAHTGFQKRTKADGTIEYRRKQ